MDRFVARAAELAHLHAAYQRARAGQGSVTVIMAEAGGGKTRLVEQFAATSQVTPAWGRAVEDPAAAYRPWRQAFRRLGIPFPPPDDAPPDDRAGRLLAVAEEVVAALVAASDEGPVVIALDDLQWADEASLHLLRILASEVAEMGVMVVATSRDPDAGSATEATLGSLTGRPAVTVLHLPALSTPQVAELLAGHSDPGAAAWVHRQSGGNALYVRELARLLADEPVPPEAWSSWLPVELRALLARRLSHLDQPLLDVVSAASVLGDEFDLDVLDRLVGRPVGEAVDAAVQRGVLTVDPDGPGRARFSHGLVRTALYSGLPSARRVELHRRAATMLEEDGALHREDQLGELALHWLRAASTPGERRRAVDRLQGAAQVAMRRLAYPEAARLLRSATATARLGPAGPDERAQLETELAEAEFRAGFVGRAVETAHRAVALAEEAHRPDIAAAAALVVSAIGDTQSQPPLLSLKERALRSLPPEPSPLRVRLEAQIALSLAAALWRFWEVRGYLTEGRQWLEGLLGLPGHVSPHLRAKALNSAGVLAQRQSAYGAAQALYEASLTIRRELHDQRGMAAALHGLGNLAGLQGDHGRGEKLFQQSLAIGRAVDEPRVVAAALANLGWLAHERGDLSSARQLLQESLDIFADLRDGHGSANALHRLGAIAQSEGDWATARSLYEESLRMQRELGERYGVVWSLSALADVLDAEGDAEAAGRMLEDVLTLSQELGNKYCETITLTRLAERAWSATDRAGAGRLFRRAVALAERLGDRPSLVRCLHGLARLGQVEGNFDRATRLLAAAQFVAPEQGERDHEVTALRERLGEARFLTAWMAGRSMDAAEAARYAAEGPD